MSLLVEYVKNLNKFIPLFFKTIIVKYGLKVISVKFKVNWIYLLLKLKVYNIFFYYIPTNVLNIKNKTRNV